MFYYKTKDNEFYAFRDDTAQEFIDNKINELELEETTKDYIDEYNAQQAILNKEPEKAELANLEQYLDDTDYISTKCYELKLSVQETYPIEFEKREQARARINELREIIRDK